MKISSKLFIGFFLIILFSILGFVINFKLSSEVNTNMTFLNRSESIIRNSAKLHKNIIEMQSAFRGYLLTGAESFLQPYYEGLKEVPKLHKEQRKLLSEESQTLKLDSIDILHATWVNYANSLISAKRKTITPGDTSLEYKMLFEERLQKQVGKKINDEINYKFKEFDRHEYLIREKRRDILNASIYNTRSASFVLASIIVTTGIVGAVYITRIISRRINSMVQLANEISQGKFEEIQDTQNDELTDLSSSLNVMSQRLNKSFTELERKNKELDQFAYVVSHDLKAPLRGMYNIFHWIQEDLSTELSDQMKKYMEMMRGRIHRLESLITGLLEYARIGRSINPTEEVNVRELLNEIGEMIVSPGFTIALKTDMPVLKTDKIRLQQVFTNLISNAVKYHGSNKGTISIDCRMHDDFLEFSVEDDGIGIAPEFHEKIFVIFQTLREKNEKESTGVGLAIVKKIIEDKKGAIRVISSPGAGAQFVFTWPKQISQEEIV